MAGHEEVVGAFPGVREAGEAALLAECLEARVAAGQQLVRVALVADVEDEPVAREVKCPMQRDRELDRAEVRGEVAARPVDHARDPPADVLGEAREVLGRQLPEVLRALDLIEYRRL